MTFNKLYKKMLLNPVLAEKGLFLIKLAETDEEVEQALSLRYKVFAEEQGRGMSPNAEAGIDRDEFDEFCLHLIVVEKASGKAVGTYRIHFGKVAELEIGFYSSREYNIEGLDDIATQTIELGRSCVHPDYRSGTVMGLLWSGLSEVLMRSGQKYLFGCVSLETVEPLIGWGLYRYFEKKDQICELLKATPVESFVLEKPAEDEIQNIVENDSRQLLKEIPPLLKGYLRIGAKICGTPAFDHEFGTIDYLILMDAANLPARYTKRQKTESAEV